MTERERVAVQLREDFPALIAAKIIDEKSAERLAEYYPLPVRRDYRKRLMLFLGVLGTLLIGGGLIMIAAHNWDMMPLTGRLAAAYGPVLAAWFFGGWVLMRRAGTPVWCESAAVLIITSLGVAIGIVSQQYHSTGTLAELVTILMLFGIFLVYTFRSICVLLLSAAGFGLILASGNTLLFGREHFYILLLLLLAVLPYMIRILRFQPWDIRAQACRFALTFMLLMLTISGSGGMVNLIYYLWAVLFACLLRFGILSARVSRLNPFLLTGLAGLLIECAILSFSQTWHGMREVVDLASFSESGVVACILATLLYSVIGWISIMRDDKFIVWMPLVFPLLVLVSVWYPQGGNSCIVFNFFMAFCGLYLLTRGVRRRRMWFLNFGMGVLLLQVVLRFCGASENYLLNGVVFIVSGLVFIGVNFFAVRYFLKKREAA